MHCPVIQLCNKPNKSLNTISSYHINNFPLIKLEHQLLVVGFRYLELRNTYEQISNRIRIRTFGEFVLALVSTITFSPLNVLAMAVARRE